MDISTQKLRSSDKILLVDLSTGTARPLVLQSHGKKIFDFLHGLAHPGIKTSQKLISQRFVWPGMRLDVKNWTRSCIHCQKAKVFRRNVAPLQKFASVYERFQHVHLDLVGPLPVSEGYSYLLTMICRVTGHFKAIPLREITAKSCADSFVVHWVARFGAPTIITGLLLTGDDSSQVRCGKNLLSFREPNLFTQQVTTQRPMVLLSWYIAA